MSDLQKQKEEHKLLEMRQAQMHYEYIKKQRERFDFAEVSHHLAYEKNTEDITVFNNTITDWILKLKPNDPRGKELSSLLQTVWRIQSYCGNLETITKTAVTKYVEVEKRNTQLASERRTLELKLEQLAIEKNTEIDALKKEIEFINKP